MLADHFVELTKARFKTAFEIITIDREELVHIWQEFHICGNGRGHQLLRIGEEMRKEAVEAYAESKVDADKSIAELNALG